MNRLVARLIVAMLAVALVSFIAVPIAQILAIKHTFNKLPEKFLQRIQEQTRPPPPPWRRKSPPLNPSPNREPLTTPLSLPWCEKPPPLSPLPNDRLTINPPPPWARRLPPYPSNNEPKRSKLDLLQQFSLPYTFFENNVALEEDENNRLLKLLRNYRNAQQRGILFGFMGATVVCIILALWLSRSIAKPIEKVSLAAHKVAQGDLSTRIELKKLNRPAEETKQLAKDFNNMAHFLERYEGERKAMVADIAHELRTPLATMQLRLDALADGLLTFGQNEVQLLQAQVTLLSRLINDLKTLSLADAGQLSLHKVEVNLNNLLADVMTHCQDRAKQSEVELRSLISKKIVKAKVDPDRLMQVLHNLLENAFKVTPKGGWVEVILKVEQKVEISVRDSGPGIPEDQLNNIFERFTKGIRRDTNSKEGSGLGLAIVYSLVHLHGGQVKAANHKEGAVFEVTLPTT